MEKRYRTMFDQALQQLEPSEQETAAERQELVRRWEDGGTPKTAGRHFMRRALLAGAAAVFLLCVTAVAVTLNSNRKTMILSVAPYEYGISYQTSAQNGVYEENGRYYLQLELWDEPVEITGQFSDTVPYVYTRYFPESKENPRVSHHIDYVIGGSGDNIRYVIATFPDDDPEPNTIVGQMAYKMKGCPVWWRTYLYRHGCEEGGIWDGYETLRQTFANYVSQQSFHWVNGGVTVDEQGNVTLSVKGETRDITKELANRKVYRLDTTGEDNIIASYDKSRTRSDRWGDYSISDYADTLVMGHYDHTVLVYRDGKEIRWAEFIYRPDGSLRYWMPWNCPTAKELNWLKPYIADHGFELEWLLQHAYEIRDKD